MDNKNPLYQQLMEAILLKIARGELMPGDKMPSVRELSREHVVNPNTMQKALEKLTDRGYLISRGTIGRTITNDEALVNELKLALPKDRSIKYVQDMLSYGFKLDEISKYVNKIVEEFENECIGN